MKTSLYFVIWIGVYYLIDILSIPLFNSKVAFLIACLIVYLSSKMARQVFSKSIYCEHCNELTRKFEQIYAEDRKAFLKESRIRIYERIFLSIYFLLCIVGIKLFGLRDFFCYAVFAVLTILYFSRLYFSIGSYNKAKKCSTLEDMVEDNLKKVYEVFSIRCMLEGTADSIYMKYPSQYYEVISMIASVLSILIGIYFLINFSLHLFDNNIGAYVTPYVFYAGLGLVYGIKDLFECIRFHRI